MQAVLTTKLDILAKVNAVQDLNLPSPETSSKLCLDGSSSNSSKDLEAEVSRPSRLGLLVLNDGENYNGNQNNVDVQSQDINYEEHYANEVANLSTWITADENSFKYYFLSLFQRKKLRVNRNNNNSSNDNLVRDSEEIDNRINESKNNSSNNDHNDQKLSQINITTTTVSPLVNDAKNINRINLNTDKV
jgi:hypothetical protein